jgi:hypothetical protein
VAESIKFKYVKSNFFRVSHVDGGIGGLTPNGNIFFSAYSQRGALPDFSIQELTTEGALGKQIEQEGADGVVRELEVGLVVNRQTALEIAQWFANQVKALDAATEERKGGTKK